MLTESSGGSQRDAHWCAVRDGRRLARHPAARDGRAAIARHGAAARPPALRRALLRALRRRGRHLHHLHVHWCARTRSQHLALSLRALARLAGVLVEHYCELRRELRGTAEMFSLSAGERKHLLAYGKLLAARGASSLAPPVPRVSCLFIAADVDSSKQLKL